MDCLGEIDVDGEHALVVWPQLGDAVVVDFKEDGHRYGIVSGLNSGAPRLRVQPMTGRRIPKGRQSDVVAVVRQIWGASDVVA